MNLEYLKYRLGLFWFRVQWYTEVYWVLFTRFWKEVWEEYKKQRI